MLVFFVEALFFLETFCFLFWFRISFTAKNVKFCSWNICGLYDHKLCDDMLGPFLKLHDVIFITETWACDTDHFRLEGYVYHNFSRKIKHPNAKRNSGCIGIFIRKEMAEGIEIKNCIDDVVVWVKLNGYFWDNTWYLHCCGINCTRRFNSFSPWSICSNTWWNCQYTTGCWDFIMWRL